MKKFILFITLAIAIILIVAGFVRAQKKEGSSQDVSAYSRKGSVIVTEGIRQGFIAPNFGFTTLDGQEVILKNLRNSPVIISFFATWCSACIIEADNIKAVKQQIPNLKVIQIGIDQREPLENIWAFKVNVTEPDWFVGRDTDQSITELYKVRSLDTTLLIDENGQIIYRDDGTPINPQNIIRVLNKV